MRRWLLVGLVFTNVSCASYFTRKGCEKVNWFQHAHDVAMHGKRLEEDDRIKQCEKAETDINSAELDRGFKQGMENYCKPETAHAKGAGGDGFNYDFCDSYLTPKLRARHQEGLKKFCQPDAAYAFASNGGIYKNQCPKDMEAAFMKKYRKGRQVYLKNQINSHEAAIASIDREITEHQSMRNSVSARIASLPKTAVVNKTQQYDATTKQYKEQTSVTEDPAVKRQREDLDYEIRNINSRITEKQNEQRQLREKMHSMRSELEGLND